MFKFANQIRTGIRLMIVMTILTGMIYPLAVAGLAYLFFPWQSGGSLIAERGRIIGSALIGQVFTDPRYFWGRPSATEPFPYNTAFSNGSNLGPGNPQLLEAVKARVQRLRQFDPGNQSLVPVDLVTTSGSGLDPDISPLAAYYQVHRVALARNLPDSTVQQLVSSVIRGRLLGILGEPRVNVLELNTALDKLHGM